MIACAPFLAQSMESLRQSPLYNYTSSFQVLVAASFEFLQHSSLRLNARLDSSIISRSALKLSFAFMPGCFLPATLDDITVGVGNTSHTWFNKEDY